MHNEEECIKYTNTSCALLNANEKQEHQEVSCQGGAAGRITHSQQHVTAGNLKKAHY